jgi:hypothetical protein
MAHQLLSQGTAMSPSEKSRKTHDDLVCSCRHPSCTITSLRRPATVRRPRTSDPVPEPLPFDLSDTIPIARVA